MKAGDRVPLKGEGTTRYGWVFRSTSCMACHLTTLAHLGVHPGPSTGLSPCAAIIIVMAYIIWWRSLDGHGVSDRARALERNCFTLIHESWRGAPAGETSR